MTNSMKAGGADYGVFRHLDKDGDLEVCVVVVIDAVVNSCVKFFGLNL